MVAFAGLSRFRKKDIDGYKNKRECNDGDSRRSALGSVLSAFEQCHRLVGNAGR
jgi:hypothetical protein